VATNCVIASYVIMAWNEDKVEGTGSLNKAGSGKDIAVGVSRKPVMPEAKRVD
jgi:hypothetical protein